MLKEQEKNRKYTGEDLALIIPTKDRPEKMVNLLDSISAQGVACGRIIVVDGGKSIRGIVESYRDKIPVEYHECRPPAQIRQRNMAISLLEGSTPLVGLFDDDIVLEEGALEAMINFWNQCTSDTAGVSFNVVNNPPYTYSLPRAFFGMSAKAQGKVLRSGYNIALSPAENNLRSEWLNGGSTVWRQKILLNFKNQEINSSEIQYAIGQISGLFAGLKAIHSGDGLLSLLNEA